MRRIIERVVTVVTTTTWKISWEPEPPHAQPDSDPAFDELPSLEINPEPVQRSSTVLETKEVDPPEEDNAPDTQ